MSRSMELRIAVLQPVDVGELLTLQRAAFLRDAQIYGDPFLPSLTQTVEELEREVRDPQRVFLSARLGPRLVGSVRAQRVGRVSHIGRLMTAPDLEGRGIASRLLAAIEQATAADADLFELGTGAKSTANIALYERRGYRIVREHRDGAGLAVVTMQKAVAGGSPA